MNRVLLAIAAVWLTISSGAAGLAHEGHKPLPTTGATIDGPYLLLSKAAAKAIGVETEKVELGDLKRTVTANASVALLTDRQAFATTMAAGRISKVLAQPGDRVKAGQELARVESAALVALQQEMLRASSELSLAEQLLKQRKELGAALITGKLLLETQTTRDSKALELGIARQKLHTIGATTEQLDEVLASGRPLTSLAVRSPIAGIVSEADVRVGQMVEPIEHLYHIVDASRVWVVADVLESDSAAVKAGALAGMRFNAVPGQTFQGRIADIAIKLDPRRHVEQDRVLLENRGGRLQAGMFGQMQIAAGRQEQAILCPTEALIRDGARFVVLCAEGPSKFRRQPVQVGMRGPDRTEILDGVFPGDRVVTVGSQELATVFGGAPTKSSSSSSSRPGSPLRDRGMSSEPGAAALTLQAEVELPVGCKSFAAPTIRGKISRVLVERGERVTAGQVLAEAESLELRNLCLEFLQMRLQLAFTKTALERLEMLGKQAAIPVQEIWRMRSRHETYHHAVQSATQRLELAGLEVQQIERLEQIELRDLESDSVVDVVLPIRAPADGWVADFQLAIGQVVAADEQLFEIQDLSQVWIKAFAFERDLPRVKLGETLHVRIVADPEYETSADISRISPVLESNGRVLYFWAEIPNPDHRLKEGMLATATINAVASEDGAVAGRVTRPRARKE